MGLTFNGKTPESITIGGKAVASLSINGDVVWPEIQADYFYIQNEYNGSNTIALTKVGSPTTGSDLSYSLDGGNTWNLCNFDGGYCEISFDDADEEQKIHFRSTTGFSQDTSNYYNFEAAYDIAAGGDLRSILNYTNVNLHTASNYCFFGLFQNCTNLIDADNLDFSQITDLATGCYRRMFYGCTSLTTAPELPATTLAMYCYYYMFYGCTSLTTAPELPATTLVSYCYSRMFSDCTSLNRVVTYAQNIPSSTCLTNWLNNVSYTGTFKKPFSTDYILGASGKPTSWTVRPILESELSYQKIEVFSTFFRGKGASSSLYPTWAFAYPTEIPSIYKENHSSIPSITIDSTTYNINAGSVSDTYLKSTNTDEKCGLYIEPSSYTSSTGVALAYAGFVINNPNNKNIKVSGHYAGYNTGTVSYYLYDREGNQLSSNSQNKQDPFTYTVTVDPYVNGIKIGYITIQISHNPSSSGVRYKSNVEVEFVN